MATMTDTAGEGGGRPRWSSRSVGTPLQHRIFYLLIRLFGRRAAYLMLYPVVGWYVLFRPSQRRKSAPYLSRRFPGRRGIARALDSFRLIHNLGKSLIDRAAVGIVGPRELDVRFEGGDRLLDLLREGRGLVIMTAHVGCWQAAMPALSFVSVPVSMLLHREAGDVDRHWFEHGGGGSPCRIIDPRGYLGGTLEMLGALKRGEVLTVMGDRVFGGEKNVLSVDFLGGRAPFPYGFFKVAHAAGSPVAVVFSRKTGYGSYELKLYRVIRVDGTEGKGAERFRPAVRTFAEALEEYAGENPWQFYNFFDMWDEGHAGDGDSPGPEAPTST